MKPASTGGPIVILLGPPGVGKGTQGALLAERTDLTHLSTGDLLRQHRREGTELGSQAQSYMDRGELVPDTLILDMVRDLLGSREGGVVFDGFPRTDTQARALGPVLAERGRSVDRVIVLTADDEVIVRRLGGRRSCPDCGAVFNVHSQPSSKGDRCDRCGAVLEHRADDEPETIRRRLDVYRKETEPLVRFYQDEGADVVFVDADQSLEAVHEGVRLALDRAEGVG